MNHSSWGRGWSPKALCPGKSGRRALLLLALLQVFRAKFFVPRAQAALWSFGPSTPLAVLQELGERQGHGQAPWGPARARVPALRAHQLPRNQIPGDTGLRERIWPQPSASPPRVAVSCSRQSLQLRCGRTSLGASTRDPAGLLSLGQGPDSGLDAGPGCGWRAPRWRETTAELRCPLGPGQVGALRHRDVEKAKRRVKSALRVLMVSPSWPFALPLWEAPELGVLSPKLLWE